MRMNAVLVAAAVVTGIGTTQVVAASDKTEKAPGLTLKNGLPSAAILKLYIDNETEPRCEAAQMKSCRTELTPEKHVVIVRRASDDRICYQSPESSWGPKAKITVSTCER